MPKTSAAVLHSLLPQLLYASVQRKELRQQRMQEREEAPVGQTLTALKMQRTRSHIQPEHPNILKVVLASWSEPSNYVRIHAWLRLVKAHTLMVVGHEDRAACVVGVRPGGPSVADCLREYNK